MCLRCPSQLFASIYDLLVNFFCYNCDLQVNFRGVSTIKFHGLSTNSSSGFWSARRALHFGWYVGGARRFLQNTKLLVRSTLTDFLLHPIPNTAVNRSLLVVIVAAYLPGFAQDEDLNLGCRGNASGNFTTKWIRWDSIQRPAGQKSHALPLSHTAHCCPAV